MANNNLVASFDIGAGVFKFVLARREESGFRVIYHDDLPSAGVIRYGIISDMNRLSSALQSMIITAEDKTNLLVPRPRVAVSGNYFHFAQVEESIEVRDHRKGIDRADIIALGNRLSDIHPADFEPVHRIVGDYRVDNDRGIENPEGMPGRQLGAGAFNISASSRNLGAVNRCLKKIAQEPADIVYAPLVAAGAVLSEEELEAGVIYVDLGHSLTTLLYFNPVLSDIAIAPMAGYTLSNLLARKLKISFGEAERLKHLCSSCLENGPEDEMLRAFNPQGEETRAVERNRVCRALKAEVERRLVPLHISEYLERNHFNPGAGFVLGGGGARLEGLAEIVSRETGYPARTGRPQGIVESPEAVENPGFHAALGTILRQDFHGVRSTARPRFAGLPVIGRVAESPFLRSLNRGFRRTAQIIRQSI